MGQGVENCAKKRPRSASEECEANPQPRRFPDGTTMAHGGAVRGRGGCHREPAALRKLPGGERKPENPLNLTFRFLAGI